MITTNNGTLQLHGDRKSAKLDNLSLQDIERRLLFNRVWKLRVFWVPLLGLVWAVPVLDSGLTISSIITSVSSHSRRTGLEAVPPTGQSG